MKPLIAECVKREKELKQMEVDIKDRQFNLKIIYAIIRSPILCDMFHKEERKRYEQEQL